MLKRQITDLLVIAMLISLFSGMVTANAAAFSQIFKDTYTGPVSSGFAPTVQSGTGSYSNLGTQWTVIDDPNSSGNYVLRANDELAATTSSATRNITGRTDKFSIEFEYYQAQNSITAAGSYGAFMGVFITENSGITKGICTSIGNNVFAYDGTASKSNLKAISNSIGRWIPVKYTIDKPTNTFQFWVDGSLIKSDTSPDGVLEYRAAVNSFNTIVLQTTSSSSQTSPVDVYFRNIELYTGDKPITTINLTGPTDKSAYTKNTAVSLSANVTNQKTASTVEFFANDVSLGTATPDENGDCTLSWTPSADGKYTIKARATKQNDTAVDSTTRSYWINDESRYIVYYEDFNGTYQPGELPSGITKISETLASGDVREVKGGMLRLASAANSPSMGVEISLHEQYTEKVTFEFDYEYKSTYNSSNTGRKINIGVYPNVSEYYLANAVIWGNIEAQTGTDTNNYQTAVGSVYNNTVHNVKYVIDYPNKKQTIIFDENETTVKDLDYRILQIDPRESISKFRISSQEGSTSFDVRIENIKAYLGEPVIRTIAPSIEMSISKGSVVNASKVEADVSLPNKLAYKITENYLRKPVLGEKISDFNEYISGSDILNVLPGHYLNLYKLNPNDEVVAFGQKKLNESDILLEVGNLDLILSAGSTRNNTGIISWNRGDSFLNEGNKLAYKISLNNIKRPKHNTEIFSLDNNESGSFDYIPNSDIDSIPVGSYVNIYEINKSNEILRYAQIVAAEEKLNLDIFESFKYSVKTGLFDNIRMFINIDNAILDQNSYGKYLVMTDKNQRKVYEYLINNNSVATNISSIKNLFDAAVASIKEPEGGLPSNPKSSNFNSSSTISVSILEEKPKAASFKDIESIIWAKNAIEDLAKRKIISGRSENEFEPHSKITRAEFVKILVSALNLKANAQNINFLDVDGTHWGYDFIKVATSLGIVNGIDENNFAPDLQITREQMATILDRAIVKQNIVIENSGSDMEFVDISEMSEYSKTAILNMRKIGIMNGVGENKFLPKADATRAECAVMIYNLLKKAGI